ncbi:MAG TPA: DUF4899 domain-containing protein [Thermotogota bacterium]|nr:DUF4899 domain-containing protein [Thermotogota bacterium]HPJ89558.1 DUF4899 domain-containing protein [Thermotogota bacterium]HPR95757.1 DUF4899 domain-containing protein [Thermotogota bacterium]
MKELDKKIEFDIFTIQVLIKNITMDELILGYFFGKKNERLEYSFFIFPASFRRKIPDLEYNPYLIYKEKISEIFNDILPDNPEILENSKKIMEYVNFQFNKIGGSEKFSKRLTYLIESDEKDEINMEILGLFENWVEKKEIQLNIQTFTTDEFSKQMLDSIDMSNISEDYRDFSALRNLSEFYPLIDPIHGVTIDKFLVGMPLKCTILSYPDDETEQKIREYFKDQIDVREGYLKPIEGIIVSKEILPGKMETYILVKIKLLEDVFAYSIVLKALRLIRPSANDENFLPPLERKDDLIPKGTERISVRKRKRETTVMKQLKEKARFKFADFLLITIIVGGSMVLIALILDLISNK